MLAWYKRECVLTSKRKTNIKRELRSKKTNKNY